MILSGREIERAVGTDIIIEPFERSKVNPNSYNLTLHNELLVYENEILDMKKPNPTKIESRPLKEGNNGEFKYNFYLDFTGNVHHCDTLDLLCSLSQELPNFSFLGNYVEYDPNDEH